MMINGIIFDLDGTLLDSMKCWENVDRNFLLENDIDPPEDVSDEVKKLTIYDSAMYFKTRFSLKQSCEDIINRIEEMVREQYLKIIPLKTGAYETVHTLRDMGFRLCVATAAYKNLAHASLERLGILDCFENVLTCSDVGSGKDDPQIFLKAAADMDCTVKNTTVIEDSLHCIETAAVAGFKTIAVYDEFSQGDWKKMCETAWKNIHELTELTEIIVKENI